MNRIICFDLETTGFDYTQGERIIEIGAVEIIDNKITGNTFHTYVNPDGKVIEIESFNVHKLSNEFLSDKPLFKDIANEFLEFIKDSPMVAHNGIGFDFPFLNYELQQIGLSPISNDRQLDTLLMARKRVNEIKRHTLDALAEWFGVDESERANGHGALIDTKILAEVYLHLVNKPEFKTISDKLNEFTERMSRIQFKNRPYRQFPISEKDIQNHKEWILNNIKNQIWYETPINKNSEN